MADFLHEPVIKNCPDIPAASNADNVNFESLRFGVMFDIHLRGYVLYIVKSAEVNPVLSLTG